jgi:hypothetical protein
VHVSEESDRGIVPMIHSNQIEQSMAESEEGRPLIKENTHQASTRPKHKEMSSPPCSTMSRSIFYANRS